MTPIFNDDDLKQKLTVVYKLRKVLQREGKGYQSVLHRRVVVGPSEAEFALCVNILVAHDYCSLAAGERGAVIVTFNPAFNNAPIYSPEEVIADACKEAQ